MTTSVKMLRTHQAYQKASLFMHCPEILLFQEAAVGTHWKIVANVDASVKLMTTKIFR